MRMNRPTLLSSVTGIALGLACAWSSVAFAGNSVEFSAAPTAGAAGSGAKPQDDSQAWHRQLWTGSFDTAADESGAAAKQLDNLDISCEKYLKPQDDKPADMNVYWACVRTKQASANFANQARSIQSQQKVMSVVSKASDVAALGAVAGVAYAELGVKQANQGATYLSAANIQQTAGQVSYVTGAADFTMGAYAYIAQKNKLEQMQSTLTGTGSGAQGKASPALSGALSSAVEAAKKAAYAHMMWGAGKLAAGYGMMYVAKRSQQQAARMGEIEADQDMVAALQAQQASGGASTVANAAVAAGGGAAPYYQSNAPSFAIPSATTGSSALSANAVSKGTSLGGASTGSSAPLLGAAAASMRSPASTTGLSGGGGGSGAGSAAADAKGDGAAAEPAKEKTAKEALGSAFEMQLTGGLHSYSGSGSAGSKEEVPNLASLMGGAGGDAAGRSAATGLNPNAMYAAALEGTDGQEQGSMAGVNGKGETSLFDITKAKLTKMFQTGSVGIPKNVEVKN